MRTFTLASLLLVACGPSSSRPDGGGGGDGSTEDSVPVNLCKVQDENAIGMCDDVAPPNSFEPELQWSWTGPNGEAYSIVTPLVANLTDDNGDGAIDLCDSPEVIVVASTSSGQPTSPGHIYLLDGKTGVLETTISSVVDATVTPALGDIDADGIAEIVTVDTSGRLIAFEHDGTLKWSTGGQWAGDWYSGALALADLDHDGDVEIIGGNTVFDHTGVVLWSAPTQQALWNATTAADLDGDGYLEVVLGAAAYRYNGTPLWTTDITPGYPQVANFDADPQPEVLVTNVNGLTMLEHDGTVKYRDRRPTGTPVGATAWHRPATIHDFDGNGTAEYAMSSANFYTLYNADASIRWSAPVSDQSGIAAGTAFDFLGDGTAEAMYADESQLFVFDSAGQPLLTMPRTSGTLTEYPVVADIDNDGSAEIVVVSNAYQGASPTVQVIRDRQDRWIQARRIWNQHAYHVTNVREDGTIPQFAKKSWEQLNTFRTNAQISGSGVCQPPIL
ncbi:MAG: VCBS repeat-containing protein [Kofleriaceae bacterium]|nr:VCBS repeat-containing protein [Kofleriaceae bacterium]